MSILTGIGAVVSAFLLAYLLFALLYPEKLG
jgi:K+-transporting ATPase KdpF subunit